jgi:hypothetical protein
MTPNIACCVAEGEAGGGLATGGVLAAGCPAPVPEPVDVPAVDLRVAVSWSKVALAFLMSRLSCDYHVKRNAFDLRSLSREVREYGSR